MDFADFDRTERKSRRNRVFIRILIWVIQIALIIGLAYLIVQISIEKTIMLGNSMEVTLQNDDKIIVDKLTYRLKEPKRFDVIVFKQSGKEHAFYNIKRIIGLPGETIRISGGYIYIDGELLVEPFETELINVAGLAEDGITLLEDEYFVLGDARNNSEDSRFANIGNIIRSDIIGRAWLRTSPDFGFISRLNEKSADDGDDVNSDADGDDKSDDDKSNDDNTKDTGGNDSGNGD